MPYLTPEFKQEIESTTEFTRLTTYLNSLSDENFAGALNYIVTVICKRYLKSKGIKYWRLALLDGTLQCCIKELYRIVSVPYEEIKISSNGQVE